MYRRSKCACDTFQLSAVSGRVQLRSQANQCTNIPSVPCGRVCVQRLVGCCFSASWRARARARDQVPSAVVGWLAWPVVFLLSAGCVAVHTTLEEVRTHARTHACTHIPIHTHAHSRTHARTPARNRRQAKLDTNQGLGGDGQDFDWFEIDNNNGDDGPVEPPPKPRVRCHSFVRSFVGSFVCSFVSSFVLSFFRSFFHAFGQLLTRSLARSLVRSFVRSFVHSLVRSLVRSLVHELHCCCHCTMLLADELRCC